MTEQKAGPVGVAEELSLPRPPGPIRTFFRENPRWMDALLVGLVVLLSVFTVLMNGFFPTVGVLTPSPWTIPEALLFPQVLLTALTVGTAIAALFLRRRFPLPSLLAVLAVSIFSTEAVAEITVLPLVVIVLLYSVPVYQSVRAGWVGYGAAILATAGPLVVAETFLSSDLSSWQVSSFQKGLETGFENGFVIGQELPAEALPLNGDAFADDTLAVWTMIMFIVLLYLVPVVLGINTGNRRRYTNAILDRAHQLARERDQRAELAVAQERTRIAREMHDVIAHSVSVMVTLSEGAAQVLDDTPNDAKEAILQSANTGRGALLEMRQLIGALRQGEDDAALPELAPAPRITDIPSLTKSFNSAGLRVTLKLESIASADRLDGGSAMELAVYRTVQESLTNALRYAGPGATVSVTVTGALGNILVRVEDDGGIEASRPLIGGGTGHGLVGLSERLRVLGGSLEYGPTAAGGWAVQATLPVRGGEET